MPTITDLAVDVYVSQCADHESLKQKVLIIVQDSGVSYSLPATLLVEFSYHAISYSTPNACRISLRSNKDSRWLGITVVLVYFIYAHPRVGWWWPWRRTAFPFSTLGKCWRTSNCFIVYAFISWREHSRRLIAKPQQEGDKDPFPDASFRRVEGIIDSVPQGPPFGRIMADTTVCHTPEAIDFHSISNFRNHKHIVTNAWTHLCAQMDGNAARVRHTVFIQGVICSDVCLLEHRRLIALGNCTKPHLTLPYTSSARVLKSLS